MNTFWTVGWVLSAFGLGWFMSTARCQGKEAEKFEQELDSVYDEGYADGYVAAPAATIIAKDFQITGSQKPN